MASSKKKVAQIDYIKLYKEVFGTEAGKLVLMDLCKKGRLLSPLPMKDDISVNLAFCEGQRQFALSILNMVEYDLEDLIQLKYEHSLEVLYDR